MFIWGSECLFVCLIYVTFCQLWAKWTSQRGGSGYRGNRAMPYSFSNKKNLKICVVTDFILLATLFRRSPLVLLHAQCMELIHGTSV